MYNNKLFNSIKLCDSIKQEEPLKHLGIVDIKDTFHLNANSFSRYCRRPCANKTNSDPLITSELKLIECD